MKSIRSSDRLVQLFERDLRALDSQPADMPAKRAARVSQELSHQVVEYAGQERNRGKTPEQMLIELKAMLGDVAPDVPSTQRTQLVAELTGRAIQAFFRR